MKKILTLIGLMIIVACSVMIVSSCDNTDWGEGDGDPSLLEYKLSEDGTYYSVAGIGDYVGTHLVIPEEYKGLPVKEIDSFALTPEVVEEETKNSALLSIRTITIADSITRIGSLAFTKLNVERINIGSGLIDIVDIPPFVYNEQIEEINVSNDNQTYMSKNGVLYSKDGTELILYPKNKEDKKFRMPKSVKTIKSYAFYGSRNINKIKIGKNVTAIERMAFYLSTIEEVKIPNSVEIIGSSAFDSCENLKKVKIGKNVRIIEATAFQGTGIEEIKIPDSVEILESGAYARCKNLKKVQLGSGITEIGAYTFENCHSLDDVLIPKNIEKIGTYAFAYCDNLTKVYYEGNEDEWANVYLETTINSNIWGSLVDQPIFSENTQIYTYSKRKPSNEGNYWHYVFWSPTVWKK
ncbi:MAG: leucine-rich repeat domain-containing protein [Clostridiales bacterium]|nr:leucine-rich repeat domain-containing protein [Clostridiales bacterium]